MSDELCPLPADAVLVHVGPHKTGTTAIQTTLANSRPLLREHGVEYPGRVQHHGMAIKSLRQFRNGWARDADAAPDPAVWTRLATRIGQLPGRVVISSEFLAQADEASRAKLVRDLGPERVHILAAARHPAAIAVSTWQQVLRKGYPVSLDTWLERNFRRSEVPERAHGFWAFADPAALSAQWTDLIDPSRITVVVLDERDRRLLPTTVEQLLALPAGILADQKPPQTNRGLTAVEAALVRQIIASLGSRLSWSEYTTVMRFGVIRRLIEVRQPSADEAKDVLPGWAAEQAVIEGERSIAGLRSSGVHVVGDLESLSVPPVAAVEGEPIAGVPIDIAAEAVVGAVAGASHGYWSLDVPVHRQKQRQERPRGQVAPQGNVAAKNAAPDIAAVPTRELAAVLGQRVRAGLARRLGRARSR